MRKKKKYAISLKECENIHDFMRNRLSVKSHHRKRTKFHHHDMPLYLKNREVDLPGNINYDEAFKHFGDNSYIFVKDDYNNIRCYSNPLAVDYEELLLELRTSKRKLLERRREILHQMGEGYDYDPFTGEVRLIREIERDQVIDSLRITEKVNRQKVKSKIRNYGGR